MAAEERDADDLMQALPQTARRRHEPTSGFGRNCLNAR
jgi:hypothetical protein